MCVGTCNGGGCRDQYTKTTTSSFIDNIVANCFHIESQSSIKRAMIQTRRPYFVESIAVHTVTAMTYQSYIRQCAVKPKIT
jgi:hypothetical protein